MMDTPWKVRSSVLQLQLVETDASMFAASSAVAVCGQGGACQSENLPVMLLVMGLCSAIALILVAFAFFREDKEEQITPLCPQLVVREPELGITFPWDDKIEAFEIKDAKGKVRAKVVFDWTDPFRTSTRGVAATVRLLSDQDVTLATVVARHMASHGQGLALCRGQCEIFGFVEPSEQHPKREYTVRHRSGVHLLTLGGQFSALDVDGTNAAGMRVCSFGRRKDGEGMHGRVTQHVDVGLVICSLLASYVHRKLSAAAPLCKTPSGAPQSTPSGAAQPTKGEAGELLLRKQSEALEAAPEAMLTSSGLAPLLSKGEAVQEDAPGASSDMAGTTAATPTEAVPTTVQAERQDSPFWGAAPHQETAA